MKKKILFILSAALLLVSCNKLDKEETVGMASLNNPRGIITSIESQKEKPKVQREIVFKNKEREIEDNYIFEEDFKGELFYPMIISYKNLNTDFDKFRPEITVREKLIDYKLIIGKSLGELSDVYGGTIREKEIRDILSDKNTLENAINPNLPENLDINVVKITDIPYENEFEGEAPQIVLTFEDENFLMSYGFNSYEGSSGFTSTVSIGMSLPYEHEPHRDDPVYIVFSGDIPELEFKAYESGNKEKEITGVSPKIEFYESNLYDLTELLTEKFLIGNFYPEDLTEEMELVANRILSEHISEILERDAFTYSIEDLISITNYDIRIFYIPIDLDIKSGERISIKRLIPSSFNFEGVQNTDYQGYHIIESSDYSIDYEKTEIKFEEPIYNDLNYIEIYEEPNSEKLIFIEKEFKNEYIIKDDENFTFTFFIR